MSYVFINDSHLQLEGTIDYYHPMSNWIAPPKVIPIDLNNYFEKATESDVAFQISPTMLAAMNDCRYIHSFVVLDRTTRLKNVDFRESFKQMISREYACSTASNVEKWLNTFLNELPKPIYNNEYCLPGLITEAQFTSPFKPKWSELSIGYCFRCASLKREITIITEIENSLKVAPKWITIYDNYFSVCKRIREASKRLKQRVVLKPIIVGDEEIGLQIKNDDLIKLDIDFSIGDYIA